MSGPIAPSPSARRSSDEAVKRTVPLALLGYGAWGRNHARVWHDLGCLRMICDVEPGRLNDAQEIFQGVETETNISAVVSRSDIEAVVVATPAFTHTDLAMRALQSGKDVLVEKPMAGTAKEAEELMAMANKTERILGVGHVLEYHPAVLKLREIVAKGMLGPIRYVYAHRLNFGRIRTEENALWSFAPHDVAIILRLLQATPLSTACHGMGYLSKEVADVTMTHLAFSGGVLGHIFVSWLHPFKEHRFVVVGKEGMAVFDDTAPWSSKLLLYPHEVDWKAGEVPVARRAEAVPLSLEQREPLRSECEHMLECFVTRRTPLTDATSGVRVMQVLETSQRSLEANGRPIETTAN